MRRFTQHVITCILAVGFALPALAETHNVPWTTDAKSRQQHALKYYQEFQRLDEQIPTLSPAEKTWLKTEFDETIAAAGNCYTKRALDAMSSREYNVRVAKDHVAEIIAVLKPLSDGSCRDLGGEATQWTRLASLFMDSSFWDAIGDLIDRKIISPEINGISHEKMGLPSNETGEIYYINHVGWANQILEDITIPCLEACVSGAKQRGGHLTESGSSENRENEQVGLDVKTKKGSSEGNTRK